MPRRALRAVVNLKLRAVTAPGVWLPDRGEIYLSICLFGQYKITKLCYPVFPLFFKQDFAFEKVYYTALDPSEVSDYLENELVVIELLQLSEYGGALRLASYSCNARDFLYPYPSLAPCYASAARELLLNRGIDFPGIAPKLEFLTVTNIKESLSPEIDALEDEIKKERRARRRSRSLTRSSSRASMRTFLDLDPEEDQKNYHKPTISSVCHSRSPSPFSRRKYLDALSPSLSSAEDRPPFVVRHLENDLIGRKPGGLGGDKKKRRRSRSRSRGRPSSAMSDSGRYYSDYSSYPSLTHKYRLKKDEDSASLSDDDDAEVAALTSSLDNLHIPVRSRSPSPLLYRSSLRERYGSRPLTPREQLELDIRVERALQRSRSRERIARLELEETLRRARSPYSGSRVHLDNGQYWSERAAKFKAKSHRQVFNDSIGHIYTKLYRNAQQKIPM